MSGLKHDLIAPGDADHVSQCPAREDVPRHCYICDGGLGVCRRCGRAEIELEDDKGVCPGERKGAS